MWKDKFNKVSAKTLALAGSKYLRDKNEKTIEYGAAFTYEPLKSTQSIRLLQLQQGAKTDVISIELIEAVLADDLKFEALSYTWQLDSEVGKSKEAIDDRPILVNGKTLRITMSLYHALIQLREQSITTPVWADQICMNQQDHSEKMAQLAIMDDIYRSASRVRIWLGKLSGRSHTQFDDLHKVATYTDLVRVQSEYSMPETTAAVPTSAFAKVKLETTKMVTAVKAGMELADFEGASVILSNRWFMRAWTLQEFILAKEAVFYMGNLEISHDTFAAAAEHLLEYIEHSIYITLSYGHVDQLEIADRDHLEALHSLFSERIQYQTGKHYTADEYLRAIRRREAAVPKDKIFAGAALISGYAASAMSYNLTTRDVFTKFATQYLWPEMGNLALANVGGMASRIDGLPTWVPDLSTRLRPQPLRSCGGPVFRSPLAASLSSGIIRDGLLTVQAATWSTVRATGESAWAWRRYGDMSYDHVDDRGTHIRQSSSINQERFGLMFSILNAIGTTYPPTQERTLDVLWQIFICGLVDPSEAEKLAWRTRFSHFFAFTVGTLRTSVYLEMHGDRFHRLLDNKLTNRKWMAPVIADRFAMEDRLASFLHVHDADHALADAVATFQTKAWGAADIADATSWAQAGGSVISELNNLGLKGVTEFWHRFRRGYEDRRLLVTENGYLGSGIEDVRAGDVVCMIAGADVPIVLRPAVGGGKGSGDVFTLVGEAYLHGVMGGQGVAFEGLDFKPVTIV